MSKRHTLFVSMTVVVLLMLLAGCGRQEESARMEEPAGQERSTGMGESMPLDEPAREAEVMHARVLDPTCGMEVDPETALAAEYHGRMYYFCSAQCRDAFFEDPGKYISARQMMEEGAPGEGAPMVMDRHRMGEDEDRPMTGGEEHEGHGH